MAGTANRASHGDDERDRARRTSVSAKMSHTGRTASASGSGFGTIGAAVNSSIDCPADRSYQEGQQRIDKVH